MRSTERPRLHLDFNTPATPPPTYSPYTYTTSPTSTSSRRSSTDSMESVTSTSTSMSTPKTPVGQRIIMGALVSTPTSMVDGEDVDEKDCSLFVPGIVLTEPPHPPTPRLPSPPIRQTVLLAPTSLPIPPPSSSSSSSRTKQEKNGNGNGVGPQLLPAFRAFLYPPPPTKRQTTINIRSMILIGVVVVGGWHLWSTLELGGLVEEALEIV
ncbi:hypothetical protein IAR55_005260 [Kwoniella newhampshirensis]|uniref:Uncharacterized protein n=1 Tax=Kwoniella newhampshirensis TaxID=1651941 RepID=A0AAW0YV77_9TREE